MRHLETEIEIAASPEKIWAILTDFPAMPTWNPFIRAIRGRPAEGERLEVLLAPPGQSPMRFRPTLLVLTPARELRWRGSLGVPGLFDGEHMFRLDTISPSHTRFLHAETFSGLLVPLIMRGTTLAATRAGFIAMNAALKAKAEI
jgi:hypothetical protein